jgi:hypothetical protein
VEGAWRLVDYLKSHSRRVHAAIGGKANEGSEDVRAFLRWIGRDQRAEFSERDIGNNFDRFKDDPTALADSLSWLATRNLIRRRPDPGARKSGRKPSPVYEVNPSFWTSPHFLHFLRNPPRSDGSGGSEGNEGGSGVGS